MGILNENKNLNKEPTIQQESTTTNDLGECLNPKITYEELKTLNKQGKYDKIKEYIHINDMLRTSMHEAAHVIVTRSFGIDVDSVSIGEQNNDQNFSIQEKIGGKSSGQTKYHSIFQFSDKNFIYTSLAGFIAECGLGINYEDANIHAQQDIHDIINKIYFYIQAEDGEKPIGFDSNGNLNFENIEPKLTKEEFNKEILKLIGQEYKNVAKIISDNRENLYTLGIELYGKEFLNDEEINLILKIQ